ncbi:MAG: precorrin-6A reductase [Treponema sp.]|jgi:precorrin-6Y C5,15-methyltransferase (decarboxylating)|nr:precorrin-6A reductase [Treponema sp.]
MKDEKIFVFAGTSEGRVFIEELLRRGGGTGAVTAFTATDYGGELLASLGCEVRSGRLDENGMKKVMESEKPAYVVDATHPYAVEASENIRAACEKTETRYLRLSRDTGGPDIPGLVRVASAGEAAAFLREKKGVIFHAAGVKEAAPFAVDEMKERVFVRVLPMEESLRQCRELGFPAKNIIAMQGPFGEEINRAFFMQTKAAWLVTKQSGGAGGFDEKIRAALSCGVTPVVIRPPAGDLPGYSIEEIFRLTGYGRERNGANEKSLILIGTGPGGEGMLTGEALEAIAGSDCVIGARRILQRHEKLIEGKEQAALFNAGEIISFIGQSGRDRFAVLLSGDGGFYSLAKTLLPPAREKGWKTAVLPGVSSLSFFCARLGLPWEDIKTISLHGIRESSREQISNLISGGVMNNHGTFFLTDDKNTPAEICKILEANGLGGIKVSAGENLSLPDERIRQGKAADFANLEFSPLSVLLAENPSPHDASLYNYGLDDSVFTRGKVPMTKGEIRTLSLSRLRIGERDVVWDIGAGTGSVSCEAALRARFGRVYAVERDEEALFLLGENRGKLGLFNVEIVPGEAPQALAPLPPPDAVFIGGSGGQLQALVDAGLAKNPSCRFVITAITLETIAETAALIRRSGIRDAEITHIAVSRSQEAGNYHLMKAENPVYIISFSGGGAA